jgi:hypothetical protein
MLVFHTSAEPQGKEVTGKEGGHPQGGPTFALARLFHWNAPIEAHKRQFLRPSIGSDERHRRTKSTLAKKEEK